MARRTLHIYIYIYIYMYIYVYIYIYCFICFITIIFIVLFIFIFIFIDIRFLKTLDRNNKAIWIQNKSHLFLLPGCQHHQPLFGACAGWCSRAAGPTDCLWLRTWGPLRYPLPLPLVPCFPVFLVGSCCAQGRCRQGAKGAPRGHPRAPH